MGRAGVCVDLNQRLKSSNISSLERVEGWLGILWGDRLGQRVDIYRDIYLYIYLRDGGVLETKEGKRRNVAEENKRELSNS